jgi:hypothetical protein
MWDYLYSHFVTLPSQMLPIIYTILAFLYLAKDWKDHKTSWRRITVGLLILLSGVLGIINNYYMDKKTASFQAAVETANQNQADNTSRFIALFDTFSKKLSDLQTQVKTEGLQKEISQLQGEIEEHRKALVQPKAALTFTFETSPNSSDFVVLRRRTLPIKNDVVRIEFTVFNKTETPALDGELILTIPDKCQFVSEPRDFRKHPGLPEWQRNMPFQRILPKSNLGVFTTDVRVPPLVNSVEFTMTYRCTNCIISDPKANTGWIYLDRSAE